MRSNAEGFKSSPDSQRPPYFLHTFGLLHTDFLYITGFGIPSSLRVTQAKFPRQAPRLSLRSLTHH